jgi:hypothetical protein
MFKQAGAPSKHLSKIESNIEDTSDRFYIIDTLSSEIHGIYFTKDDTT